MTILKCDACGDELPWTKIDTSIGTRANSISIYERRGNPAHPGWQATFDICLHCMNNVITRIKAAIPNPDNHG